MTGRFTRLAALAVHGANVQADAGSMVPKAAPALGRLFLAYHAG
jgi:hypothetical protein